MKKRVIQAFAVVCCGVVMFSTGVTKRYMSAETTDTTEKYSTTAGISSVLAVNWMRPMPLHVFPILTV